MSQQQEQEQKIVTDVAIYLRKSRADSENDLENHKKELLEKAKNNNWKYVIYSEIGSADTIVDRPKMVELLEDIRKNLFDAVLVYDYDRLGRGNLSDQAQLKETFSSSDTLIITPNKTYNLRNDSDDMLSDFEGMIARYEYKQIKKRLQRGKKQGVKWWGNWTHGKAPFPYGYNAETKKLVVNEEKRLVFNMVKDRVLKGDGFQEIARDLNKQGYRSDRGKLWSHIAVSRMISNEVLLGKVIFGKKHKGEILPRSEWMIFENAHEALMTEVEFQRIKTIHEENKRIYKSARTGTHILSGLLKCDLCGYGMVFDRKNYGGKEHIIIKACQRPNLNNDKCINQGLKVDYVLDYIRNDILEYEKRLTEQIDIDDSSEQQRLTLLLKTKEDKKMKLVDTLARIKDIYEMGDYTREEFLERRDKRTNEIKMAEQDIEEVKKHFLYYENLSTEEKIQRIQNLTELWDTGSAEEINKALRLLISHINYLRVGEKLKIEIVYL